jgi:hypothetical protein
MRRSLLVLTKLPQRQRGDNSRENHLALQSGKVVKQKKKKRRRGVSQHQRQRGEPSRENERNGNAS